MAGKARVFLQCNGKTLLCLAKISDDNCEPSIDTGDKNYAEYEPDVRLEHNNNG